jgi:FtsP/CotA-like multicopper oxidase with cupredoxin domain
LVLVFSSGLNQSALAQAEMQAEMKETWVEPPVLEAHLRNSEGKATFTVNLTANKDENNKEIDDVSRTLHSYTLRSYEFSCDDNDNCNQTGTIASTIPVGPTIKVKAGDTLNVHLQNDLSESTNLHTHGLHIDPEGIKGPNGNIETPSDNVLWEIPGDKGQSQDFKFHIRDDHYPGTFWYHPHHHGTTADQVADGMAGALIVEDNSDALDSFPWIKKAQDRIFVLQQIPALDTRRNASDPSDPNHDCEVNSKDSGNSQCITTIYTTVNGVLNPTINMAPGALERWRFIHAGQRYSLPILFNTLENSGFQFKLIALDGITLDSARNIDELELYPGYRADVIVKAPKDRKDGTYLLSNNGQKAVSWFPITRFPITPNTPKTGLQDQLRDKDEDGVSLPPDSGQTVPGSVEKVELHPNLVTVTLTGTTMLKPRIPTIPTKDDYPNLTSLDRPNDIITDPHANNDESVEFNIYTDTDTEISEFQVNGQVYSGDPEAEPDFCLKLGDAQKWKLTSSAASHPFHIHVNAFQVVDPGNSGTTKGDWHDTIIVNRTEDDETDPVIIKTRYDDFTGKFVLHCHILPHEDSGMMSLVEITKDGNCNTTAALPNIDK